MEKPPKPHPKDIAKLSKRHPRLKQTSTKDHRKIIQTSSKASPKRHPNVIQNVIRYPSVIHISPYFLHFSLFYSISPIFSLFFPIFSLFHHNFPHFLTIFLHIIPNVQFWNLAPYQFLDSSDHIKNCDDVIATPFPLPF